MTHGKGDQSVFQFPKSCSWEDVVWCWCWCWFTLRQTVLHILSLADSVVRRCSPVVNRDEKAKWGEIHSSGRQRGDWGTRRVGGSMQGGALAG